MNNIEHDKILSGNASTYATYRFFVKLIFASENTLFHFPFLTPICYKIVEDFNIKYIGSLVKEYPEIKSCYSFYNAFKKKEDLSNVISPQDRILILDILRKNGLVDDKAQNQLLIEIAYYFIVCDISLFIENEKVSKIRFILKKMIQTQIFLAKLPNISLLVSFFSKNDLFTNEQELIVVKRINTSLLNHLNEKLKRSAGNLSNPMMDYFISQIVDTGINNGVKNHYTHFCIPILKELKINFPEQFSGITSFSNKRLMGRVKEGRKIQEEINL